MKKLKLIIADDEPRWHKNIRDTLDSLNIKYDILKDFDNTDDLMNYLYDITNDENIANEAKPDILFLDHFFQGNGLDGLDCVEEIKGICPNMPILLLTTSEYGSMVSEKKKEIGFGYLQKPVKSSDLLCQIEDIFEKNEYREKLKSFQDELTSTRKWACDVLKLNDITVGINEQDIKDDEVWSQYQAKVLTIVEKMKEEELQKTGKQQFETIKKELMHKYKKFEEGDMNFLATGEFLWKNYKDQLVDFSPILISYSKFLESVLRKMLLRRHIITSDEESMLGASIRELRYHPYSFGSYNKELVRKISYKLSDFTQYRNKAAHPEGVTSAMLEAAKNILFATGKGEKMAVLDFIHLYY